MQIFAGMDLEAEVYSLLVEGIEDGLPAASQLCEGLVDETGWALRPGVEIGPGEGAGEGGNLGEIEAARGAGAGDELLLCPLGTRGGIAADGGWSESVEQRLVRRMDGDELAEEMSGELADFEAVFAEGTGDFVAVVLAVGGALEIEETDVVGGNLKTGEAEASGPWGDTGERVEGCGITDVLGEV